MCGLKKNLLDKNSDHTLHKTKIKEMASLVAAANGATSTGLKISDLIKSSVSNAAIQKPLIAFEYYPPKTEVGVKSIKKRFASMAQQKPLYIDMTWGAGGSTSDLTLDLCVAAKEKWGLEPNMHLTCTNMDVEKITKGLEGTRCSSMIYFFVFFIKLFISILHLLTFSWYSYLFSFFFRLTHTQVQKMQTFEIL